MAFCGLKRPLEMPQWMLLEQKEKGVSIFDILRLSRDGVHVRHHYVPRHALRLLNLLYYYVVLMTTASFPPRAVRHRLFSKVTFFFFLA